MRRRAGAAIGCCVVGAAALAWTSVWADQDAGADADEPAPPVVDSLATGKKFDHAQHASEVDPPAVTEENCKSCHPTDKTGKVTNPGERGHQPCMTSGCHVDLFLSTSEARRKKDPAKYKEAVAFCLGCHRSDKGEPPRAFQKPAADNVFKNNPNPNHHVEITHFEHLENEVKGKGKVGCRDCHVVDATTNELQLSTPGHTECAQCHGVSAAAMSDCAQCHSAPGPAAYFVKQRKGSEIRSCKSEGHADEAKRRKKKKREVRCFKHETKQHRFQKDGSRLECGHCHWMFEKDDLWAKNFRYDTLKNIRSSPVIDDKRKLAHKRCGDSRACHARAVSETSSGRDCGLCHSAATYETSGGLF